MRTGGPSGPRPGRSKFVPKFTLNLPCSGGFRPPFSAGNARADPGFPLSINRGGPPQTGAPSKKKDRRPCPKRGGQPACCKATSQPVSRVLFSTVICLAPQLPAVSSDVGEGGTERTLFLLSCIGWGLQGCGRRRPHGGLLPRLSILTAASAAVYFCCTVLEVAFTGCYPAPCSVMLGLSSWRTVSRAPATVRLTCGFYYSIIYPYLSNYHTAVIKRRSGDGSRAVKAAPRLYHKTSEAALRPDP